MMCYIAPNNNYIIVFEKGATDDSSWVWNITPYDYET